MKRVVSLLLVLLMLLSLCACGSQPAPQTEEPAPQTEEPAPQTEEPAPQTEEPAPQTEEPAPQAEEPAPALSTPAISSSSSGGGFSMDFTPATMPPVDPVGTAELDPLQVDFTPMVLPDFSVAVTLNATLEMPDLASPFTVTMPDVDPASYIKTPAPPLELADHLMAAQAKAPGQAAKGSTVELSFSRAFFCQHLTPEDPDQVYVGYEAPDGMRFLVIEGEICNLSKQDLKISTFGLFAQYPFLALAYCEKGLYQGIFVMGSEDGKSLVDVLPAGETRRGFALFPVPEEAAETADPVAVFFGCSDFSDDVFFGTGNLHYDSTAIEWDRCDFLAFWAFAETVYANYSCDA